MAHPAKTFGKLGGRPGDHDAVAAAPVRFPEGGRMPEVVFSVDQSKSMRDQAVPGHNRWHPDIPPAASVRPGSEFRVECREWTDSQLTNSDSANDVRDVNLNIAHMLSGPVEIEGAQPGDLLCVDILDLGPCQPPQEY